MPWFDFFIVNPVVENGIVFDTEKNLKDSRVPVLILHARDDEILPYQLSEKVSVQTYKIKICKIRKRYLWVCDFILFYIDYVLYFYYWYINYNISIFYYIIIIYTFRSS